MERTDLASHPDDEASTTSSRLKGLDAAKLDPSLLQGCRRRAAPWIVFLAPICLTIGILGLFKSIWEYHVSYFPAAEFEARARSGACALPEDALLEEAAASCVVSTFAPTWRELRCRVRGLVVTYQQGQLDPPSINVVTFQEPDSNCAELDTSLGQTCDDHIKDVRASSSFPCTFRPDDLQYGMVAGEREDMLSSADMYYRAFLIHAIVTLCFLCCAADALLLHCCGLPEEDAGARGLGVAEGAEGYKPVDTRH